MKFSKLLFLILISFNAIIVSGQSRMISLKKRCPERTINFENGLLNNATTNIITDVFGFTWVSTKIGIQRFNGFRLQKIIPVVNKDTFNINYSVFFFGLENGCIWISIKEGILEYDPYRNSFRLVVSYHSPTLMHYAIIPLKETKNGIWCMEENNGIVIYDREGLLVNQYTFFSTALINDIIKYEQFNYTYISAQNDHCIFINDITSKRIISIDVFKKSIGNTYAVDQNILGVTCNHSRLYLLTDNGVLCESIKDNKIIKSIPLNEITNEISAIGCIRFAENNQLLFSVNNHLYELDSNCIYHYEITDLNRNPIIGTGSVSKIYTDKFQRIWLLTNNDIKRIENREIPFAHFIYPNEKNNFIKTIYFDEQKKYLIAGCFNGEIQLYDTLANPVWSKPLKIEGIKYIIGIEKLTENEYLAIGLNKGWYLLNVSTKKIKPFYIQEGKNIKIIPSQTIYPNNTQRINDSTILICTAENVFDCKFRNTKLVYAAPKLGYDKNNPIDCFLYSSLKTLWTGTNTGLVYKLDPNGHLQTINIPDNYIVRSISEDVLHNIWVGTDKGLYIYSKDGIFLKKIIQESGLSNDCIYSILPVPNDTAMFASSNLGLSYISKDGNIKNYSKEMGLQENEFNTGSAIRTKSGKFYFGGINGITAFYASSLFEIKDNPVINFTRLIANDSLYKFSPNIYRNDSVIVNYTQNHLNIDVAALGLLNTDEYEYQFRLKGFEKDWQITHNPTDIKYVLQPGTYLFEVNCSPIFSSSGGFKKSMTIIISPAWWQTWFFDLIVAVIAILIIGLILHQYNRRKYQQKIRSLQMQQEIQRERERISRDLHDNLGAYAASIASNIDQITIDQNDNVSEVALAELHNNSVSIVSQLTDTIWALKKETLSLTAISDRSKVFIQKIQLSYPAVKINVSEQILDDHFMHPIQAFHLLQIIQEAVTNALRHSKCQNILLRIEENREWKISILDDGIGIKPFKNNSYDGNGLSNMIKRATESGCFISWEQNVPSGTIVVIKPTTTN